MTDSWALRSSSSCSNLFFDGSISLIYYIIIYILVNYNILIRGFVPQFLIGTTGTGTDDPCSLELFGLARWSSLAVLA